MKNEVAVFVLYKLTPVFTISVLSGNIVYWCRNLRVVVQILGYFESSYAVAVSRRGPFELCCIT